MRYQLSIVIAVLLFVGLTTEEEVAMAEAPWSAFHICSDDGGHADLWLIHHVEKGWTFTLTYRTTELLVEDFWEWSVSVDGNSNWRTEAFFRDDEMGADLPIPPELMSWLLSARDSIHIEVGVVTIGLDQADLDYIRGCVGEFE